MPEPSSTRIDEAPGPVGAGRSTDGWRAYHVFYHGETDLQLSALARPLLRALVTRGIIDRFFFVRYHLGGPHLRLRWRTHRPGDAERALEIACRDFFRRYPSTETISRAQVLETNRILIDNDPMSSKHDNAVFPNHSWGAFPPRLEVERYGGELRFATALDAFCLSSLAVLRLNHRVRDLPVNRRRVHQLRLLASFSWGLADDEHEFNALAAYGIQLMGESFEACRAPGNALFERRSAALTRMVAQEMERANQPSTDFDHLLMFYAGRYVAAQVRGPAPEERWYLLASHLHMTANRLGLSNAEEVYSSQILLRAVEQLKRQHAATWQRLWEQRPVSIDNGISTFTSAAIERWAAQGDGHEGR